MVFPKFSLDNVNRATETLDGAAGKSLNVAKVLKELGEHPVAVGFLGGDRGEELRRILARREIETDFVMVEAPTRQCITIIDESTGMVTELVEESRPVAGLQYERVGEIIQQRIPASRAVIMSGTLAPGGPCDFYRRCTQWAHDAGALSVVDAQGAPLIEALKAKPGLVKPNRLELARTLGCEIKTEKETITAMRSLCAQGAARVVVTAGKEATLAFDGHTTFRIESRSIKALNPIGSGDSFTAGVVWRLLQGEDLGQACRWGAATGAANALTLMAGELDRGDVSRLASEVTVERID
jgi:1-phosphofructokinase family hexose kinase